MPLFDFICKNCGATKEYLIFSKEDEPKNCDKCGGKVEKNLNNTGIDIYGPSDYLPGQKRAWRSKLSATQHADLLAGKMKNPY